MFKLCRYMLRLDLNESSRWRRHWGSNSSWWPWKHPTAGLLWLSSPHLQVEAALHLVGDHLGDGQGGSGGWRGSIAHVEHATPHLPDAAVKHKVVHEVPVSVEGLSANSSGTPAGPMEEQHYVTSFLLSLFLSLTRQCRSGNRSVFLCTWERRSVWSRECTSAGFSPAHRWKPLGTFHPFHKRCSSSPASEGLCRARKYHSVTFLRVGPTCLKCCWD